LIVRSAVFSGSHASYLEAPEGRNGGSKVCVRTWH
jgi:hypothetical protein